MRIPTAAFAAGLAAAGLISGCASVPGVSRATLAVTLNGLQQVPGPGDPDGSGTAEIRVDPGQSRLCWDLYVRQVDAISAAHIHRGAAGTAGPPVVTLTTPGADGRSQGCTALDADLARRIATEAHEYYVNVHSAEFPAGAVRGQLRGGPIVPARQPQRR